MNKNVVCEAVNIDTPYVNNHQEITVYVPKTVVYTYKVEQPSGEYIDLLNLKNGEGKGSVQTKDVKYDGENIIFDDGTLGTQKDDIVPGAIATGFAAVAFGGLRWNYYNPTEDNYGRTPTSAEGNQSFAAGGSSHAYGDWAVAMGKDANAYQGASLSVGGGTQAGMTFDEWKTIYGNGNTDFTEDTKIIITMDSGDCEFSYKNYYSFAIALGDSAKAYQRASVAIGKDAKAHAWNAIAIGKNATAGVSGFANEGDSAIALGLNAKAIKSGAMALGNGIASGVNSLVLQSGNAIGESSVAIKGTANGVRSVTIGPAIANWGDSFAIGHAGTTADAWNSFAIGRNAKSTADTSFSYGFNVTSSATGALAVNEGTQALGKDCFAAGCYTKTHNLTKDEHKDKYGQAVFGHYNIGSENNAFEIGNGTAARRSNVFAVDWNGDVVTSKGTLATQQWVQENGGGAVDTSNIVTIDTTQVITGRKTFNEFVSVANSGGETRLASYNLELFKAYDNTFEPFIAISQYGPPNSLQIMRDKVVRTKVEGDYEEYCINLPEKSGTLATLEDCAGDETPKYLHTIVFEEGTGRGTIFEYVCDRAEPFTSLEELFNEGLSEFNHLWDSTGMEPLLSKLSGRGILFEAMFGYIDGFYIYKKIDYSANGEFVTYLGSVIPIEAKDNILTVFPNSDKMASMGPIGSITRDNVTTI